MATVRIHPDKREDVRRWCEQNIAPQSFYIHTKYGGRGWQFTKSKTTWLWDLTIEDEHMATIAILKFG
jgi:hypothetical protein